MYLVRLFRFLVLEDGTALNDYIGSRRCFIDMLFRKGFLSLSILGKRFMGNSRFLFMSGFVFVSVLFSSALRGFLCHQVVVVIRECCFSFEGDG